MALLRWRPDIWKTGRSKDRKTERKRGGGSGNKGQDGRTGREGDGSGLCGCDHRPFGHQRGPGVPVPDPAGASWQGPGGRPGAGSLWAGRYPAEGLCGLLKPYALLCPGKSSKPLREVDPRASFRPGADDLSGLVDEGTVQGHHEPGLKDGDAGEIRCGPKEEKDHCGPAVPEELSGLLKGSGKKKEI